MTVNFQNGKTLVASILLIFCAWLFTGKPNNAQHEGQVYATPTAYISHLPFVASPAQLASIPGFIPPNFEMSQYEVPVTLPPCDENALIINPGMALAQIDWQGHDVFCLLAGDYANWGELLIQDVNGTANYPKVLRYYDPANASAAHPVERAAESQSEAVIQQLTLKRSDYWVFDGLTIRNSPVDNLINDSSNNIFNRLLIEKGDASLLRINRESDNNVIQNSVLRNHTDKARHDDQNCILLYTQDWDHVGLEMKNTRIVNNEIYNCNDGIQLKGSLDDRPAFYPGTIIENNDIYITNALYTDCMGNPDPNGACACAENAVDIKATISEEDLANEETWVRLINNRMWGFRNRDDTEDEQGNRLCASISKGTAIVSHFDSRGLVIQGNVILNSARGISGNGAINSNPAVTSHFIVNNLIYNIHDCYDPTKQGLKQFYLQDEGRFSGCADENGDMTDDRGMGLVTTGDENGPQHFGNIHYGNTLIDVGNGEKQSGWWAFIKDADHEYVCNTVLNSFGREYAWHTTNSADKNAYYTSTPYCPESAPCEGTYFINEATVEAAKHAPFTFQAKRWTGPEPVTIPHALHTEETPRFDEDGVCWVDDPSHLWNSATFKKISKYD